MTTKIILIPIDRLKALEKISTYTPAKLPADVEFKLLQQNKNLRHMLGNQNRKNNINGWYHAPYARTAESTHKTYIRPHG